MLAHGMKNRLTPAVTATYMLQDDAAPSPEKVKNLVDLSVRSLQSALDVLTSLEDFARIQPKPPVSTNIAAWLQRLGAEHQVEVLLKGEPVTLMLDTSLWGTIVSQLLLNVKQHGGAKATLHWSREVVGEVERLEIRLEDGGSGLGKMTPDRALEATRKSERSQGAGLGLSKVLWAAMLLDGSVELSHSDTGGTIAEASGRAA